MGSARAAAASAATCVVVTALGALDAQGVTAEIFAVELFDHRISNFLVVDVGEAETTASTGLPVEHGFEADSFPDAGQQALQLLGFKSLRQVADVKASAHGRGEG